MSRILSGNAARSLSKARAFEIFLYRNWRGVA